MASASSSNMSWININNLDEFNSLYTQKEARVLVIIIKLLHESFNSIVRSRQKISTFGGLTELSFMYNTNIYMILSF